ncbi:MAG TPA: hypothetical protein VM468_05585, partial [Mycoplana sp.]|nr:hypothetical protein [Mycoplana sp.]
AMLAAGQAASNRTKPAGFIYDQWRRALRIEAHQPPAFMDGNSGQGDQMARPGETGEPSWAPRGRSPLSRPEVPKPPTVSRTAVLPAAAAQARRELRTALAAAAEEKRFVCRRKQWCAGVTPAGWRIVTLDDPAHLGVACDSADFVVAPQFLRRETCRSGARLITAASLRRTGALEITRPKDGDPAERDGYRIIQAVGTLNRPWARHRLYDWRTDSYEDPNFPAFTDSVE